MVAFETKLFSHCRVIGWDKSGTSKEGLFVLERFAPCSQAAYVYTNKRPNDYVGQVAARKCFALVLPWSCTYACSSYARCQQNIHLQSLVHWFWFVIRFLIVVRCSAFVTSRLSSRCGAAVALLCVVRFVHVTKASKSLPKFQ